MSGRISLTEVTDGDAHYFVIAAESEEGERILAALPTAEASEQELAGAERVVAGTATSMGRELETDGLAELLAAFDGVEPATRVWTWAARGDVGFYHRRMHQETLVHRVDAELERIELDAASRAPARRARCRTKR